MENTEVIRSDKTEFDWKKLIREILIGLRGDYSQGEFGKKLQTSGDQIYRWESGHTSVTWSEFVDICSMVNVPLAETFMKMVEYSGDLKKSEVLVAHLIKERPQSEIAKLMEVSRSMVSRWQSGLSEPSLEQMLRLLNCSRCTLALILSSLLPAKDLPSISAEIKMFEVEKKLNFQFPWIAVLIQTLFRDDYLATPHSDGYLAGVIGISVDEEKEILASLLEVGSIQWNGRNYIAVHGNRNFAGDFEGNRRVREYWTERCLQYIQESKGPEEAVKWGCALIDVSLEAHQKMTEAYYAFLQELNTITHSDKGKKDRSILLNLQFIDIDKLPKKDRSAK